MSLIHWTRLWNLTCDYSWAEKRANMSRGIRSMAELGRAPKNRSALPIVLFVVFLLSLGFLSVGCARPGGTLQGKDESSAPSKDIPFHPGQDAPSALSDGSSPTVPPELHIGGTVPFGTASHAHTLPPGTLLTVELGNSLAPAQVHAGDVFKAKVAEPVTVDGATLLEGGTAVSGRVESAQAGRRQVAAERGSVPGYVRLTLSSISVDGRQIPVQTSSLFARGTWPHAEGAASAGGAGSGQTESSRVQKGRLLTFRLTAPLMLDVASAMAARQYPPER